MKIQASYHQERLWFIDKFENGVLYDSAPIYHNIPLILNITGPLEIDSLTKSIQTVIDRHESLRTLIITEDDKPFQVISQSLEFTLAKVDKSGIGYGNAMVCALEEAKRPFVLHEGPLIRGSLIQYDNGKFILVITLHHIIADRQSMGILQEEIFLTYQAYMQDRSPRLPELSLQYADFSQWQHQLPAKLMESMLSYWKSKLSGKLQPLELPIDRPRVMIHTYQAKRQSFSIPQPLYQLLKGFGKQKGVNDFVTLLAVFKVMLYRYSGHDEIVVGISSGNRNQPGMEKMIGPSANLLVTRDSLYQGLAFQELVSILDKTVNDAHKHQYIPFDKLVLEINPAKDMSRTAFFDVLFQYEEAPLPIPSVDNLEITPVETNLGWGKYDLNLQVWDSGENFNGIFVYNSDFFNDATITRMIGHYTELLAGIMEKPEQNLLAFPILTDTEKEQLISKWNSLQADYPHQKTIHQLFAEQVAKKPGNIAVKGPGTGTSGDKIISYTYRQLQDKSNRLAAYLREKGVRPDTIVAMILDRSVEMISVMLGILKAGGAYLPIDPEYPRERIDYMLSDSGAQMVLSQAGEIKADIEIIDLTCLETLPVVTATLSKSTDPANLCYVIYTSGTTGKPKGVLLEHKNVVRLMVNDKFQFDFNHTDVWTMFHSYCFDFSVWEMYGALLYGGKLIIIPRMVARETGKFLELLKEEQVTVLNQTPSAFYSLIEQQMNSPISDATQRDLSLRYIIFGGEALNPARLKDWKIAYPDTRLINMYGITETTVHVTFKEITQEEVGFTASNIGTPIPTLSTYILNNNMNLQPLGVPGECCVGGDGVARGYLNRPELTHEKFIENPYKPGEKLYRSGDLIKMLENDEMEYLGRIDRQVKIRGFRIEMGEIENRLLTHDSIKEAVVLLREISGGIVKTTGGNEGDASLSAYIIADKELTVPDLRDYLSTLLPSYMIPSYFVQLDKLPLTPNGKTDFNALPMPEFKASEEYLAPSGEIEETLAGIWSDLLGVGLVHLSAKDNFFDLGGHSLKAIKLIAEIHKDLNVKIPLSEIFQAPTIKELAQYIERSSTDTLISLKKSEIMDFYELSSAQKRMFVLNRLYPDSTGYNIYQVFHIEGDVDKTMLEEAFLVLIQRHEVLRTAIILEQGRPVQQIYDDAPFEITYFESEEAELEKLIDGFSRPFDLSQTPLLRVGLIQIAHEPVDNAGSKYILLVDMHHIITDAISSAIFVKDFITAFSGGELPPVRFQYKDYSEWQNCEKEMENMKHQEEYWLQEFAGEIPLLSMPVDFPRKLANNYNAEIIHFHFDVQETEKLKALAVKGEATLFMVLLTAYTLWLSKLSGQEDIIVGVPIAGRRHPELENIMGMFTNTLAIRNISNEENSFQEFMHAVKEKCLEAFENQDYQFEDLVNKLPLTKDTDRSPLFDAMFDFLNVDIPQGDIPQIQFKRYDHKIHTANFDLRLMGVEKSGQVFFSLKYKTALFKKETMERFTQYFKNIVFMLLSDDNRKLKDMEIISQEERAQILFEFNNTDIPFPTGKRLDQVFEDWVEKDPDQIALGSSSTGTKKLSYRELNERAGLLAGHLRRFGDLTDKTVAILLNRSYYMVASILAVWKAGGAYIPLDTDYPVQRVLEILNDSNTDILISLPEYVDLHLEKEYSGSFISADIETAAPRSLEYKESATDMNSLAYVIYTSGSTGKPKGAMVEHKGMMNHIWAKVHDLQLTPQSIVVQSASQTFDISVWQFFSALAVGGRTLIYSDEIILAPERFLARLVEDQVTILEVVPSYLAVILDYIEEQNILPLTLHYLLVTGEEVKPALVARWFDSYNHIKMVNAYGPTEASDDITHHIMDCAPDAERVPIGKTLHNLKIYIVDNHMKLSPVGVKGEICVSGIGVGRGYLNNKKITETVFLTDPFSHQEGVRLYKTGDLGRWLPDGTIEFFGRKDYQVKIRGFRIELGEIENKLVTHPNIKDAVVLDKEDAKRGKYLCAYVVMEDDQVLNITEAKDWLLARVPEYMVPAIFLQLDKIPLSLNGKIDRKALPEPVIVQDVAVEFISSEVIDVVRKSGQDKALPDYAIDVAENYLNSIAARLESELSVLEQYTRESGNTVSLLSYPQKMIYFIDKKHIGTGCSNIVFFVKYSGIIDPNLLEETVNKIVYKHQSLRLKFMEIEHESGFIPVQYESQYEPFTIPRVDFSHPGGNEELRGWLEEQGAEAFNLLGGDLFYFAHVKISERESGCYIKIHNIVSDGLTFHILIKEINKIYKALKEGKPLTVKPGPSYFDFVSHEQDYLRSKRARDDMGFFLNHMLPPPKEVNLSSKVLKDDAGRIDSDCTMRPIPSGLREKLHQYSKQYKVSWYKIVLSALSVYIYRSQGIDDMVIGSLVNNRASLKYIKTAGIFIHFLPIRVRIDGNMGFNQLVSTTGKFLDDIIAGRQSFPFEVLAGQLRKNFGIDPGYFYNVNMIGYPDLENVTMERPFAGFEEAPFSLYCNRYNRDFHGVMEFEWIYRRGSFTESEIKQMHHLLENVLEDALDHPDKMIGEIELLSASQKEELFNRYIAPGKILPPYADGDHTIKEPRYYILSETGKLQPEGVAGELCVGGKNTTIPLNDENSNQFFPDPFIKGNMAYRTGRYAKRHPQGDIEDLGSLYEQVWIKGVRVDSGEIKNALLKYEAVVDAEVIVKETLGRSSRDFGGSHRYLCGCIVTEKALSANELNEYLSAQLPSHMVPSYYIRVEKMPLTSEGKTDRKVLENINIEKVQDHGFDSPQNPVEEKLVDIWHDLLGIEKDKISTSANFFDLGGHSLKAISAVSKLHKEFNVKISLEQIFKAPTIKGLADYIIEAEEHTFIPIETAEKKDHYALSSGQKRLFLVQQFDTKSTAYNMPRMLTMEGQLDMEKLEMSFRKLIERHESLRTSFEMIDEVAMQKISENVDIEIEYHKPLSTETANIIQQFIRPFDLSASPLLRVGLVDVRTGDESSYILMVDMHHIISDGVSNSLLISDFIALYNGAELPPLKLQYKDYSDWQNSDEQQKVRMEQKGYWRDKFSGGIPLLDLQPDFARPPVQRFDGDILSFEIGHKKTKSLNQLAGKENTTLFNVLFAAFNVLLAKLTSQEDIVVGTPTAGRRHVDLEPVIGFFINTLGLRNFPIGDISFRDFLNNVKESTLKAFENQDFPFEELLDEIDIRRDFSRNPLFDVMFMLQNNFSSTQVEISGLKLIPYPFKNNVSKFDFTMEAVEVDDKLFCTINYCTALFKQETIQQYIKWFKTIIAQVIENPYQEISHIEIISAEEREQLLYDLNDTKTEYPQDKCIYQLFQEQAQRTPDLTPVVCYTSNDGTTAPQSLNYKELDEKSNQLAHRLREAGGQADTIIGIMVERSLEMFIGILGIMKSGSAYLPIDPGYPEERIRYMVSDSNMKTLVGMRATSKLFKTSSLEETICIEDNIQGKTTPPITTPGLPKSLAYVIYTSGSTGRPKGTPISHRNVNNYATWFQREFNITQQDNFSFSGSFCFDMSVTSILVPLISGATVYTVREKIEWDPLSYIRFLSGNKVSIVKLTPTQFRTFKEFWQVEDLSALRYIILGGEAIDGNDVRDYLAIYNHQKIVNEYGPTEATVAVVFNAVHYKNLGSLQKSNIPIGKPTYNHQIYILDKYRKLVPTGVVGELCIAGVGLSRGYLNKPELTVEKFIMFQGKEGRSPIRIYRTGDLGRWLPNGNIECFGRMDTQVKIKGYRIELEEIDTQLSTHEGVEAGVVAIKSDLAGNDVLVAYVILKEDLAVARIREYIASRLPSYMVPSLVVTLEELPIAASGKIDRKKLPDLPDLQLTGSEGSREPIGEKEKILVDIWSSVLGMNRLGVSDNFFELGGDSIKAIQVVSRLRKFKYSLNISDIFLYPTVNQLSKHMKKTKRLIDQRLVVGDVQLTPIHAWFFAEYCLNTNRDFSIVNHYNQSVMLQRKEGFDPEVIEQVFKEIILHHDALRMIYSFEDGKVVSRNRGQEGTLFDLDIFEFQDVGNADIHTEMNMAANRIQQGMNLGDGPLVRLGLFKTSQGDHLLIAIHHVVVDGVSWRILLEDFAVGYRQVITNLPVKFQEKTDSFQYWAGKLKEYAATPKAQKELAYWKAFNDKTYEPFPVDQPMAGDPGIKKQTISKNSVNMVLTKEETENLLRKTNYAYTTTINDILLTALGLAIKDWAQINQVLINFEGHGREDILEDIDINRTVGWFTTHFPVALDLNRTTDLSYFIKQVKETFKQVPNRGIGYGILRYLDRENSEDLQLAPPINFNYLGQFGQEEQSSSDIFGFSPMATGTNMNPEITSPHLIDINGMLLAGKLTLSFSYNNDKYEESTIAKLVENYRLNLGKIIEHCVNKQQQELTPSDMDYKKFTIDELAALETKFSEKKLFIENIYRLSPMQSGMFYHYLMDDDTSLYFEQYEVALQGRIDKDLLEMSFNKLLERYDVLRTFIVQENCPEPLQMVIKQEFTPLQFVDIATLPEEGLGSYIETFKKEDRQKGFDLSKDKAIRIALIKTGVDSYKIIWSFHHIIMDGWCMGIVFKDLIQIYVSLCENQPLKLEAVKPYSEYIQWLEGWSKEDALEFWDDYLNGYQQPIGLPKRANDSANVVNNVEKYQFSIDEESTDKLVTIANENQVTVNTLIETIWGILIQKMNQTIDVVFGKVVSGRPQLLEDVEYMVGLFINSIPVRIKLEETIETFPQLIQDVQQKALLCQAHEYLPLADIESCSSLKNNLLDHIIIFENTPVQETLGHLSSTTPIGFEIVDVTVIEKTNYHFCLLVAHRKNISITFLYNPETYDAGFMKKTAFYFKEIINQIQTNKNIAVKNIQLYGQESQSQGEEQRIEPTVREEILGEFGF
jgi:amino acid adenylation domain-containing protein/non-ribosomal peptide synthase protein (TIGR01720 family)